MTIMQLLSGVASRGTTVVCTLHQPRPQAFELLDGVLLLSRGRVAFFGAPSAVAEHFASAGCPLGGEGGGLVAGGVGLGLGLGSGLGHADAMLDVVAEAESAEGDMDGGSEAGAVIMSRDVLVEKVRCHQGFLVRRDRVFFFGVGERVTCVIAVDSHGYTCFRFYSVS